MEYLQHLLMRSLWVVLVVMLAVENGCNGCSEKERIALLQLKDQLPSWEEDDNMDCCQWKRVECNSTTHRVIKLELYGPRDNWRADYWYLNASILLPFESLRSLDLSGNRLRSFVGNEGGHKPVGAGQVAVTGIQLQWRRPMYGWVKINFDGGLDSQMKSSGIGIVIRDSYGRFRAARAIHFGHLMEPVIIEAMAARESLIFAQELGLQKVHIEGDSQQVVNMIQRTCDFTTSVGVLIANVNRLKQEFVGLQASFVRRGGNSVAHAMAKNAVRGSGIRSWEFYPPPWLFHPLCEDGRPI